MSFPQRLGATVLIALFVCPFVFASKSDDAFDQKVESELAARNPEAVPVFREANALRQKGDHARASALYARVTTMVPDYDHAIRRQAWEEAQLGRLEPAINLARKALSIKDSPENKAAVATLLLMRGDEKVFAEAEALAKSALEAKPDDPNTLSTLARVALAKQDVETFRTMTTRLEQVAADEPEAHLFAAIRNANDGDFDKAHASLDRARALGLPQDQYEDMRKSIDEARPLWRRVLSLGMWVVIPWLAVMLILLGAGFVLSKATLSAAEDVPTEATGHAVGGAGWLRKTYSWVLTLCSVYYYISIPIILFVTIGIGGGLIYAFFALGRIPVKLVVIIGIFVLVTVWSVLKSLFIRVRDDDPGLRVDLKQQPKLRRLLSDVAKRIGTRPVDNVYLTPGTDIAVMERGSLLKKIRGRSERCLILGVGVLPGLKVRPFKAVLGHEYGHFVNKDTAGGGIALAVRNSLGATAGALAEGGAAAWYNPAWLFISGFYRVFLRISQGASRLQEILADRWAAFAYGAAAFEQGLTHAVAQSVRFDHHANATVKHVVDNKMPLTNLYAYVLEPTTAAGDIEQEIQDALTRETSVYDSHPAPAQRFEWVHRIGARGEAPTPDDEAEVWTLFYDREAVEKQMTAQVRENLLISYGVEIPETTA